MSVIAALSKIMAELPAIGKDMQASAQQGGYNYRGIEAITREAQPLLAKHGVVFVPHVQSAEVVDILVNSKPWSDTRLLVSYTVYGPGGVEDRIEVGPIFAIGRDNADKGANKCMTQAFKYALIQALCISDAKDDGDAHSVEADSLPVRTRDDDARDAGFKDEAQRKLLHDTFVNDLRLAVRDGLVAKEQAETFRKGFPLTLAVLEQRAAELLALVEAAMPVEEAPK